MKKYLLAGALVACLPSVASAQEAAIAPAPDFAGPRIEARLGWETPTVSSDGEVYKIGQAVSYGAEVGYDFQAGSRVVVGPYVNYDISGVEACSGNECVEIDSNLSAGLRLGYEVSPNALVYGKVGYARMRISAELEDAEGSVNQGGVQGSLGFEMNFGDGPLYGNIEASYGDYGDFGGINLQRRHVSIGVGARF